MRVWQYCRVVRNDRGGHTVIYYTSNGNPGRDTNLGIEHLLGKLGVEGWELVTAAQTQDASWMFKREGREGSSIDALSI